LPTRWDNAFHLPYARLSTFVGVKRKDRFGEAAENNTRDACAPQILFIREPRRLPLMRFNDLTGAKQFVFIRVYSWLTFADVCG